MQGWQSWQSGVSLPEVTALTVDPGFLAFADFSDEYSRSEDADSPPNDDCEGDLTSGA